MDTAPESRHALLANTLVERIAFVLRRRREVELDSEQRRSVYGAVIAVLEDTEVAIDGVDASHFDDTETLLREYFDEWITNRVERAMRLGLSVACRALDLPDDLQPPRVLVRRRGDMRTLTSPAPSDTIEAALGCDLPEGAEELGLLVLADGGELDRVLQGYPTLDVAGRELGVHFRSLIDSEDVELGKDTMGGVQLFDLSTALHGLQRTLEVIAHKHKKEPRLEATGIRRVPLIGRLLAGKYRILKRVGRGGFGNVYEAEDVMLGTHVAIKLLDTDRGLSSGDRAAFRAEARRLTRLSNPHTVDWKSFHEESDGTCFLVMELLEGERLDALLRRELKLEPRRAARLVLQVLDALRTAHHLVDGTSILHLDLKPSNVFVLPAQSGVSEERAKVIDFGIGQYVGGESIDIATVTQTAAALPSPKLALAPTSRTDATDEAQGESSAHSIRVTADLALEQDLPTGVRRCVACTPEYASPEQCGHLLGEGEIVQLDGRSDLYSLGVMAYQMLSGELPYPRPAARGDWLRIHREDEPRPLRELAPDVPRGLARWVMRCLVKDRDQRWNDSREAYDALLRWLEPSSLRQAALIGVPIALVLGGVGLTLRRSAPPALEPYVEEAGTLRRLSGETLWMGPLRSVATLRIEGWDTSATPDDLRLVAAPDEDAPELTGFGARWSGEGSLELSARGGDASTRDTVYVALADDSGATLWSRPFELAWLPTSSWSLGQPELPGGGALPIDPSGAWMQVAVNAPAEALSSVVADVAGRKLPFETHVESGVTRARLSLAALGARPGPVQLTIVAVDRAGGSLRRRVSMHLVSGALALESLSSGGAPVRDALTLPPDARVDLALRATTRADLSWRLRSAAGKTLAEGGLPAAEEHALRLPEPRSLGQTLPFSGTLELELDDLQQVARAEPSRGRLVRRIDVFAPARLPELRLRVADGSSNRFAELSSERALHLAGERATLQVTRSVPTSIDLTLSLLGPDGVERPQSAAWLDPARDDQQFELELPREGRYTLTLGSAWSGSGASESQSFVLVADRTAPTLRVRAADGALTVVPHRELPQLEIECGDAQADLDVAWSLHDARGAEVGRGRLPGRFATRETQRVAAPLPMGIAAAHAAPDDAPRGIDGAYALRLEAVDSAGNRSQAVELALDVGLSGPELELLLPAARLEWTPDGQGRLELRARVSDANGTDRVRCRMLEVESGDRIATIELERVGDGDSTRWEAYLQGRSRWSGLGVRLLFEASDGLGRTSALDVQRRVGTVVELLPERIAVSVGDAEAQPMLLVRGNGVEPYVFGGRHDSEEDALFRRLGLGEFNDRSTERSWRVEYERGAIGDYYLDEREVAVGEYLAFLRGGDGWDARGHWPAGAAPTPARRAELERHLASIDQDLPVTQVTWEEAFAYARWVGKRLPSWVEWEYALRGGTSYRAGCEELAPWPSSAPATPIARGGVPDGPLELGSRVSEWTSNPYSLEPGGARPDDLAAHARVWRSAWLSPPVHAGWESAPRYWVVGGSYRAPQADFTRVTPRRRTWSAADVGFRCALSGEAVTAALAGSEGARVTVREDQP